jgi:CBS domain containing-hemolysin-like protein
LKERPRQFIITILIGNNLVNTGASAFGTVVATNYFGSQGIGIATGIMTFLLLTFGEIIPKSFATSYAEKISLLIAKPSLAVIKILAPFVAIFEWLVAFFLNIFGATKTTPLYSEAELRTMVEVGVKEKSLGPTEKEFIEGVLEFKQTLVKEIMTPKRRIFCLEENLSVEEAILKINKREHTRIPIYRGTREHIVGIVYLKDVLKALTEQRLSLKIKEIAKKPLFVYENKLISVVFKELQGRHVHLAMVVDKRDEVKGIVTLEDIIEEIVGDIFDEKDISPVLMKRITQTKILVHGNTEIEDINTFFNVAIPWDATTRTINHFLNSIKKKELQEDTKLRWNNLTFIIREIEEKKPVKIFIEKNSTA